ncbi:MAG: acetylglutamate kinase [[Chlorobium] sp. 445]|nr:MAG: acetylglutamate kinase [[Chlorobium] sp. 445]
MRDNKTKEEILIEALPYITSYENKTFVIKYGGAVMNNDALKQTFAQDVTLLKKIGINIIVVHGGGKDITEMAQKLGVESRFVNGVRYTDEKMIDVVIMVLAGALNKEIAGLITKHGGNAVGLCGVDNALLRAKKLQGEIDLGLVGDIVQVNTAFLKLLMQNEMIPVVAPIGLGEQGELYNINADVAATEIAVALKAEKLVYLSDTDGVIVDGALVPTLAKSEAQEWIEQGKIYGGMIPKVNSAFEAIEGGVNKVHFINGGVKHALLLEIFTNEGIGTEIINEDAPTTAASQRRRVQRILEGAAK